MNLKQAIISFWFKELEYNPICKVGELESHLKGDFKEPFLINEQEPFINIGLPRIAAKSDNMQCVFNMTLVNANLNIAFNNEDKDQAILLINEKLQLVYDALKEVYDLKIVYASIKVEYSEKIEDSTSFVKSILAKPNDELEDFMLKTSIKKDDKYYINHVITTTKEINVDLKLPSNIKPNDSDMMMRSMLVSLKNGKIIGDIKNIVLEINNRLAYNLNPEYLVLKDDIRDLLFEFKKLINNEIK